MALEERTVINRKEILEDGTIQVRTATIIERDGVEVSRSFTNRQVFSPGADVSGQDAAVQAIAAVEHTPERVLAYQAKLAAKVGIPK